MCGIVGYSGPKEPLPILINGLSRLEYRGYDSAGIAISDGSKITIEKKEGKLDVLKEHLENKQILGNIGIGHKRWATLGVPNDVHAHPHARAHAHAHHICTCKCCTCAGTCTCTCTWHMP